MSRHATRRVVVTGMGAVTPLGNNVDDFYANLIAGATGIRMVDELSATRGFGVVDVDMSIHFSVSESRQLDRVSQMAIIAAKQAVAHAGSTLQTPLGESSGVFFGTGMGGAQSLQEGYFDFYKMAPQKKMLIVLAAMTHAPASHIGLRYGIQGESQTYSSACSSSSVAIGEAFRRISDGYLNVALAGGAEALLLPAIIKSWTDMKVLCQEPNDAPGTGCRPFSADRDGFSLAEGAAVLVLESLEHALQRGAQPIAEIVGYGVSNDAKSLSKPDLQGQKLAFHRALTDANIQPEKIGYINAHGTATMIGDVIETNMIKEMLGQHAYRIPVSSTKSAHGHLLGATGAVEMIATILALKKQIVPPTTHWSRADSVCDLNYVPGQGLQVDGLEYAMSNSFAFGGSNAVLVVKNYQ
ncbi:beta-ketoacyl-[acyl-carrier-protein] synthase family protein [Collimonas pratensis]|uniref:Nodulation protein E n=1 Tax=Collimonas pratensis TaxID=279113 RepID=A0A127Q5R6_9BURK|nr:beta-ketoacyl-[acyl-carrier-protein] synthase family protein [Collimonas pratensis]AMP05326.1 beta-ketoacyl synthase, C-terminal domain protein [Collimonas pratensis]